LAEARERACVLALLRALPAFFVARDLDRFVAVVLAPRVFFHENDHFEQHRVLRCCVLMVSLVGRAAKSPDRVFGIRHGE
jgi:hypothetical protein